MGLLKKRVCRFLAMGMCLTAVNGLNVSAMPAGQVSLYSGYPSSLVINEVKANIPEDEHVYQYIELRGTPGDKIQDTYMVIIDGDEDETGHLDYVQSLDGVVLGDNGLLLIKNSDMYADAAQGTVIVNDPLIQTYDEDILEDGIIEHDAITFMLIKTESELKAGDDIDSNDDGALELPEGTQILDSFGWLDGGDGICYSPVVLHQSASDPDAATRFYNNMTPFSINAWANGDIFEDPKASDEALAGERRFDPNEASANLPPNAKLTPGAHNFIDAPLALLSEIKVTGDDEYIELVTNGYQDLEDVYAIILDKDSEGQIAYAKNLTGQVTGRAGMLMIQHENANLNIPKDTPVVTEAKDNFVPDDAATILLIYSADQKLTKGFDLDQNDDGVLDTFGEAYQVLDTLAYGQSREEVYGDVVIDNSIMAASRFRGNRVVGASSWLYGNVSDNTYVLEEPSEETENAHITPGDINITEVTSYLIKTTLESARTTQTPPDADDIAYWVHPEDDSKGFVIGTQKQAGYSIYDTSGNTLADVNPGNIRFNNVDVVYGFDMNGESIDIAVFTDRMTDKFVIYKITEDAPYLTNITDPDAPMLFGGEEGGDTAYGSTVYKSVETGKVYGYATQNSTYYAGQYEFQVHGDVVGWEKVRDMTLEAGDDDEHAEGMVVDQEYGTLYICQEEVGIYKTSAEADGPTVLGEDDLLAEEGDHNLREDIEGITLYYTSDGQGYVLVSSQGSSTFAVFDRVSGAFLLGFALVDNGSGVDGSDDTDSLDVMNRPFGQQFEKGLLIVQDGQDTTTDSTDIGTNFKWVKWDDIASVTGLKIDTNYDPRNPKNRK